MLSRKQLIEKTRALVFRRQTAYRKVFDGPWADVVLADLAEFCRATGSTFHPDSRLASNLDGRREVWLRIMNHLNVSQEQLYELLAGQAQDQSMRLTGDGESDV